MGYNIGLRLIDDFLAKTNTGRCATFRETAEMISKVCIIPSFFKIFFEGEGEEMNRSFSHQGNCIFLLADALFFLSCIQVGFKIFLNITPTVTNWTSDNKQFSLILDENPLADFVELPDDGRAQDELWFSSIYCGILRGALEMVGALSSDSPSRFEDRSNISKSIITLSPRNAGFDASKPLLIRTFSIGRCKCRWTHNSSVMSCEVTTRRRCASPC